jgi:fibronectin-binding autotransporter adhesin
MKTPHLSLTAKLSLVLLVAIAAGLNSARAGTEHWTGAGTDLTWTNSGNWTGISPPQSYFNDVDFYDFGGTTNLADFSVNNIMNGSSGVAQMPIYMLRMYPTNRNFTTMISSGEALYTGAGTGDLYVGGDSVTSTRGVANLQETITFEGSGAMLAITGTLHIGQGLTNTVQTVPASTNYVTLNMSGLDYFVMMTNISGGTKIQGITISNTASGTAATRFLLCGQIQHYSQGAIYLAKTNIIVLGNDMEIGAMGVYSNSMPCPVYLGISNSVLVGNNGAANGLVTVGSRGNTNAFMVFNPAFLGGPTPPTASFASPATINGGRVTTFYVCRSDGGVIPAYGYADYTGGNVSIMASTMQLGYAGTAGLNATGVLTFDNGIVNVNTVNVGNQSVSGGGAGVGTINVNTNSTYATNGTLVVNNVLTLGAVTGTLTAGTAGTLNLNGGALDANTVTNNGGVATVNMTNANWSVAVLSSSVANMNVSAFNAAGATNIINITAITPFINSTYPARLPLVAATTVTGGATLGLGSLPASDDPSHPYAGYIDGTTTPGQVALVLTAGPAPAFNLVWSGTNAGGGTNVLGGPDSDWDIGTTKDWLANGVAETYAQLDQVTFYDVPLTAQTNVNLTTALTPYSITVSNNASLYTFSGSGSIGSGESSGTPALAKQGAGTLILDNTSPNTFTGGVTITSGVLQIGTNDTGGNLPSNAAVVDNSVLAYDRTDNVTITNVISGSGAVLVGGGGTLQLDAANSFTGNAIATNNSTLKGGIASAFGTTNGAVVITSGSTLDPDGVGIVKTVSVAGTGVGGEGAIINSGGAIYDTSGGLTPTLTLTGNATLSYPNRWDLGSSAGATLSTGGQPYSLTLNSTAGYFEWRDVKADTNLANITIAAGTLGITGSSTLGNPADFLDIPAGTGLVFYNNDGFNVSINKQVVINDEGVLQNGGGSNTMNGGLVITNSGGNLYCQFNIGGTSLTVNSAISGNGVLWMQDSTSPLILNGNGSAFTGGVLVPGGSLTLNGSLDCGVTNSGGTTIDGIGSATGTLDVSGTIIPGTATTAGTLTVGGLVLEGSSSPTFNLASVTTTGGGVNSFIQDNGILSINVANFLINPLAPLSAGSTYTLIACSSYTGALPTASTVSASVYTFSVSSVATSSNTLIKLTVTGGGQPSVKLWNNAQDNGEWDVQTSQNWSNLTTHVSPDYFYTFDSVIFDDSISTAQYPTASIDIASGQAVIPTVMTNNSTTNNYTISGAGKISGLASIVKLGTSTLTLATTNDFTGSVTIASGTLLTGNNSSLGNGSGTVYVTNGGTLDLGYSLGSQLLVMSGAGVNGAGALVNSVGSAVFDNPGGLLNLKLAGNATIGGANRIDFGQIYPGSGVFSSGGSNYSLTVVGTNYREWDNVTFDANFGNINVETTNGGAVGIKGLTTLGNSANTLAVFSNAIVELYEDSGNTADNVTLNKKIMLYGGSTFENGGGTNVVLSPIALGVASGDNCTLNIGGVSLTVSNAISGLGNLIKTGSSPLVLPGTNTYTGGTYITGGSLDLIGNGSISDSANIYLSASQVLDVSGRTDQTLTLASGQTLQGSGTLNGNLTALSGSTVAPGTNGTGTLTVTNSVTLAGTTSFGVGTGSNNLLKAVSINYGGTLSLSFVPGSLAAGNSFTLFNSTASAYTGSFSSITPSTPGSGLAWGTSLLNTSGTLTVIPQPRPATFGPSTLVGTNLTLTGSGGADNGTYRIYSSTNVIRADPLSAWTLVGTNSFSPSGTFSFPIGINTNQPAMFYMIVAP